MPAAVFVRLSLGSGWERKRGEKHLLVFGFLESVRSACILVEHKRIAVERAFLFAVHGDLVEWPL